MDIDRSRLSPMMRQYMETKDQYSDCVLFYRLGDFYEMFFDDAVRVSKELELTLTGKECGLDERAPMCGVPYHAVDNYLSRLVRKGYKVAIAEQIEDPKLAKGLVKRAVTRVVTPGTLMGGSDLDESKNNYIMCVIYTDGAYGIAVCDVSTGEFLVTEATDRRGLLDEIYKYMPSELVCNDAFYMSGTDIDDIKSRTGLFISTADTRFMDTDACSELLTRHFRAATVAALGLADCRMGMTASGVLLGYLYDTQKNTLPQITKLTVYSIGGYMLIDTQTRRNLELVETMREKKKIGSLLWTLDQTRTAMGARLLRRLIEQPLLDKTQITKRQDAIEELCGEYITREELSEYLGPIYDLERITGRISCQSANPRDLTAFLNSLEMLPHIKKILGGLSSELFNVLFERLDTLEDLADLIRRSINDDPPVTLRDGGIIKEGYSQKADELRRAGTDGKKWLAELEARERESTGIKNLRIKYNRVFGYYFEVTNSMLGLVPEHFQRKQTLTNAERFTTDELKELEETIMGAEEKLCVLEYDLFCDIRDQIASQVVRIQQTANALAWTDALVSLSKVASKNDYVRPKINENGIINIKGGRHPVVERLMKNGLFVPNDTFLDSDENRLSIITGPNMAGKSTYMRQVALICLMAQMGSFVPASSADICISDRIFTRVGASDDLASGQSTFMVEMTEVSNILRNATRNSLVILDEIGRGTSTYDGMSIAWAVIEYISGKTKIGAKTLFATHYHELTELEGVIDGVKNYCVAVNETGDDIVFLRKIMRGGADKSYGIQVAKLAGIPEEVITRAKEISDQLTSQQIRMPAPEEEKKTPKKPARSRNEEQSSQMSIFDMNEMNVISELREMPIETMTPMEALNTLYRIREELKDR